MRSARTGDPLDHHAVEDGTEASNRALVPPLYSDCDKENKVRGRQEPEEGVPIKRSIIIIYTIMNIRSGVIDTQHGNSFSCKHESSMQWPLAY